MDIYKFVVSNSIRNYLKRINYKFSTQEAAFLVWYCETATLEEKFGAWEEIINTMPNCSMQERIDMEAIPDFHKFLIDYIKLQTKLLNKFKTAEKSIYSCEMYQRKYTGIHYEHKVFNQYDECVAYGIKEFDSELCDRAVITKHKWGCKEGERQDEKCYINSSGAVLSMDCMVKNDQERKINAAFDGMWFDFPTPFHAGDIVCSHYKQAEPYVLTGICTWNASRIKQELPKTEYTERYLSMRGEIQKRIYKDGDTSDMECRGYGISMDECVGISVWKEILPMRSYLDLEYYSLSLSGTNDVLALISGILRGEYNIEFLLNAYSMLIFKNSFEKKLMELQTNFGKDQVADIGIFK